MSWKVSLSIEKILRCHFELCLFQEISIEIHQRKARKIHISTNNKKGTLYIFWRGTEDTLQR